jgi:hypothetical protein
MKKKTIKQSLIEIEKRLEKIEQQIAGKTLLDRPYAPMPSEIPSQPYKPQSKKMTPWATIKCPKCGKDTGIGMILNMVIPPEGLACPHCLTTIVAGNTITCCDAADVTVQKGVRHKTASSIKYTWDNSSAVAGDSANFKNE